MIDDMEYGGRRPTLAVGEAILWRGKPKRRAFILSKSLVLLPIAIVWLCIDIPIIASTIASGEMLFFLIPFFTLHLMPVWLWLVSAVTARRRWQNTNYYVTNRRIILQGGFFAVNETSLFYKDIRNTQVRVGLFNRIFRTGHIVFDNGMYDNRHRGQVAHIMEHLEDPESVYDRIQRTVLDIQTDMEYPNAFRPAENPGYRTDYEG